MPLYKNDAFRTWLNPNNMIKLSSDVDVVCITYEVVTKLFSITDFDRKSIE